MDRRLVFAHQSVGMQVISGIEALATDLGQPDPLVIDVTTDTIPGSGGFVGHFYCGTNGDGFTKTDHLDSLLRGGLAAEVDTVVLKFCYADLRSGSGYTPADLFAEYSATMDALATDYPAVTFIFATETIVNIGDEDHISGANALRQTFNDLVRAEYGSTGLLWDVALAESTDPDGNRTIDGGVEYLYLGYASADLEHISGVDNIGRKAAATPLLLIMAGL